MKNLGLLKTKNREDGIIGLKFGRLKVKEKIKKNGRTHYVCECDCGNITTVLKKNILTGNTKSCGCIWKEEMKKIRTKHGKRNTRLYGIWVGIIKRIKYKNSKNYKNYGGRGITVCSEWEKNFQSFYEWAMSHGYRDDLTIDRIDVNGNYCPENCRWAKMKEQSRNKRTNNIITYKGETLCATEWEEKLGFSRGLIYARQKLGWNIEKIMTTRSRKNHDILEFTKKVLDIGQKRGNNRHRN